MSGRGPSRGGGAPVAIVAVIAAAAGLAHLHAFPLAAFLERVAALVHAPLGILALAVVLAVLLGRATAGRRPPLRAVVASVLEVAYARASREPGTGEAPRDARPRLRPRGSVTLAPRLPHRG